MNHRFLQLLQKYDVPGPRYTSYPTVPAWTMEVGVEEYQSFLQNVGAALRGCPPIAGGHIGPPLLSLYFHLPFCESLCHFCGCMQVITKDHSRSREAALRRLWASLRARGAARLRERSPHRLRSSRALLLRRTRAALGCAGRQSRFRASSHLQCCLRHRSLRRSRRQEAPPYRAWHVPKPEPSR